MRQVLYTANTITIRNQKYRLTPDKKKEDKEKTLDDYLLFDLGPKASGAAQGLVEVKLYDSTIEDVKLVKYCVSSLNAVFFFIKKDWNKQAGRSNTSVFASSVYFFVIKRLKDIEGSLNTDEAIL